MTLAIANVVADKIVVPTCGKQCNECDPSTLYNCAAALTRTTREAHTIAELCDHCQVNMATTIGYRQGITYKLCRTCNSLPPQAFVLH